MKKTLTFGLFYDLFIAKHTNMIIRKSINQIFYGNTDDSGIDYVSQAQCSKIRKDGIMPGSQLCKDYLSEDLSMEERAAYIKGLNLYGLSSGRDILNHLSDFYLSDTLRAELATETDVHAALAKLLYFLIAIPPQAEKVIFSQESEADSMPTAKPAGTHIEFFDEVFLRNPEQLTVDMAFHSGHDYFYEDENVALLHTLLEKGYHIRVLVNLEDCMAPFMAHTRQPGKVYQSFDTIYGLWVKKMHETSGQLTVRRTDTPLLHKMYLCHNSDGFRMGHVRFFLYGSYNPLNEIGYNYQKDSIEYQKLETEFNYLWNNCEYTSMKTDSSDGTVSSDPQAFSSGYDLTAILEETLEKAKAGDPTAMFEAGCMYFHGFNNSPSVLDMDSDYAQAAKWLNAAATSNHPVSRQAEYMIARMSYYGEIPTEEQSYKKSYLFRKKLQTEQPTAVNSLNLLDMKKRGMGTDFNYDDILTFIEENLDTFNDSGLHSAASFYISYGEFQKAISTLEKIRSIVPEAEYQLGMLYLHGLHRNPPRPEPRIAEHHLGNAADCGMDKAIVELGRLYFQGSYGYHQNHHKARALFKKAAVKGDMNAQYHYAWLCRHGLGGDRDYSEAKKYFEQSANSGHYHSMTELAQLYQRGEYRNYEKAFEWARKASESGNLYSEVLLGNLYFTGRGCRCDLDKALIHYKKALKYGFYDAGMMIRRIEEIKKKMH